MLGSEGLAYSRRGEFGGHSDALKRFDRNTWLHFHLRVLDQSAIESFRLSLRPLATRRSLQDRRRSQRSLNPLVIPYIFWTSFFSVRAALLFTGGMHCSTTRKDHRSCEIACPPRCTARLSNPSKQRLAARNPKGDPAQIDLASSPPQFT